MKTAKRILVLALLLCQTAALPADVQRQVFQLLSSLSGQYREQRGEPAFKETVALLPFAEESAAIRKYELAAVVESLVAVEMSRSTYFVLAELAPGRWGGGTAVPKYGFECSRRYLQAEAAFVLSPGRRLALSAGGGGIFGLWSAMVKLNDLPVYIGTHTDDVPDSPGDPDCYVTRSVILNSSNSLLLGLTGSLRAELFLSPRLLVFACAHIQQLFASEPFCYTCGGSRAETRDGEGFVELSGWQPNKTPWGDEPGFDMLSVGLAAGLSFAF